MKLIQGDCLIKLKELPDNSVDAIVTDPPYELGFMGIGWDKSGIANNVDMWKECLRVLKPGGHLLAFSATRTYHRLGCAIEDAGFEIRDMIEWIHGQGFPKSLNIGKAIDKIQGNEREVLGESKYASRRPNPMNGQTYMMNQTGWDCSKNLIVTKGNSEWEGWGSTLKPAQEPICVARKPLEKGLTIVENVLKWGTGVMNIDGCRVAFQGAVWGKRDFTKIHKKDMHGQVIGPRMVVPHDLGRFPANVILSHHPECENECHPDCPVKILDEQSGISKSNKRPISKEIKNEYEQIAYGKIGDIATIRGHNDKGGASRFFYVAKPSKSERNKGLKGIKNPHPTVKPVKLMEYLITLVTAKNQTVLDPFVGAGTTGIAAKRLERDFIGIELNPEYLKISESRIAAEKVNPKLFD